MTIRLLLAAVPLGLALCGCDSSARAPDHQADSRAVIAAATEVQAVKDLETRFIAGWESKNPVVRSLYAPDAVMVTPSALPHQGPTSIAAAFDRFAANRNAAVDFSNMKTVVSAGGDLAFSQGIYTARRTNPEKRNVEVNQGYYLLIYQKQTDGSWKVVQDVSSPLPDDFGLPPTL